MKTASGAPKSKRGSLLSEINVTPFVDVMLVLLIIFMATAPMLQQGIGVSVPQTKASGAQISKEPFILKIKKDQKIYIGDLPVPVEELAEKLTALFEQRPKEAIYLQADKSAPYGAVAQALGEIKFSGFHDVSLITVPK